MLNLIDTPGHSNFVDEIASGIRVADGAVVVVDAVEGVLLTATQTIQHLVKNKVPITYVLSSLAADLDGRKLRCLCDCTAWLSTRSID